jgi:hypothetical protein
MGSDKHAAYRTDYRCCYRSFGGDPDRSAVQAIAKCWTYAMQQLSRKNQRHDGLYKRTLRFKPGLSFLMKMLKIWLATIALLSLAQNLTLHGVKLRGHKAAPWQIVPFGWQTHLTRIWRRWSLTICAAAVYLRLLI